MLRAPRYFFYSPTARRWFETDGAGRLSLEKIFARDPASMEGFLLLCIDPDNVLGLLIDSIHDQHRDPRSNA